MAAKSTGNKKWDTLRDRACSQIIWGEREEFVYQFLQKEGLPDDMCDAFLLQANQERSAMIRKRSLIKFIAGLVGTIICGVALAYFEWFSEVQFTGRRYFQLIAAIWTGFSVSGLYALKQGWALLSGKTMGSAMDD